MQWQVRAALGVPPWLLHHPSPRPCDFDVCTRCMEMAVVRLEMAAIRLEGRFPAGQNGFLNGLFEHDPPAPLRE